MRKNTPSTFHTSSEECEPGLSLASLDNTYTAGSTYTVGSAQLRLEPDQKTALVKEGEFETPETIAAIEKKFQSLALLSTDRRDGFVFIGNH